MDKRLKNIWSSIKPAYIVGFCVMAVLAVVLGYASLRVFPLYLFGGIVALGLLFVILRNPWHGMLMLAFFIPFERLGSADIAGFTLRPSQMVAALTMLALLLWFLKERTMDLPKNPTVLPLLAFAAVGVLGLFNAPNLQRSVLVFGFTLFTMTISIIVPFLVNSPERLRTLLRWFSYSFILVTLFGLFQFAGDLAGLPTSITGLRELYTKEILGFPRVQSTALEPLYFANYLLTPLCVLLALFLHNRGDFKPHVLLGLFVLGSTNLVLTVARGGYISFAASALLLLAYYFVNKKLLTFRNIGLALLGTIVASVIVLQVVSFEEISEGFITHVVNIFDGASFNERVEMFEVAGRAFDEHPLIGIGSGSFGPYESGHPYLVPEHGWRIVNNEYLELLAENGIFGFAAIILVFLMVLVRSVKALVHGKDAFVKTVLLGVLAGFCGILVQYNTFSILYIVHIWFTIGMLIALQNIALGHYDHESRT